MTREDAAAPTAIVVFLGTVWAINARYGEPTDQPFALIGAVVTAAAGAALAKYVVGRVRMTGRNISILGIFGVFVLWGALMPYLPLAFWIGAAVLMAVIGLVLEA